MKHFLFFAGSSRQASLNKQVARGAASIATRLGINASFLDLADYPMPLYNGDDEAQHSLPDAAIALKARFVEADGFFITSPEYNGSFSPLLKNTIDWLSRTHSVDEPSMAAYRGKIAGLAAASPGGLGGLRGLVPLRMLLGNIGVTVVTDQTAISQAGSKFDGNGNINDEKVIAGITRTIESMRSIQLD